MTATSRLNKEYKNLIKDPVDNIRAAPLPHNILEWRFCLLPPNDCVYAGGQYHGKLVLPKEYPHKPPRVMMITPSGRFATNTRLCMSMSDFHPETWNPSWQCRTVILGLLSFMLEEEITAGSIKSTDEERRAFALKSKAFNATDTVFRELFPDLCQSDTEKQPDDMSSMIGQTGVLKDLGAAKYNGKIVKVTAYVEDIGRFKVEMDDGQVIKVKPINFEQQT
eukprot:m.87428 g.87428  ORF g.87428 m.87428 type:complete len:222 (-) comp26071_c0_seq1:250-915(-)